MDYEKEYIKLNDYDLRVLDEVEEITLTDFGIKRPDNKNNEGYIQHDCLIAAFEELIFKIKTMNKEHKKLEERFEDYRHDNPPRY